MNFQVKCACGHGNLIPVTAFEKDRVPFSSKVATDVPVVDGLKLVDGEVLPAHPLAGSRLPTIRGWCEECGAEFILALAAMPVTGRWMADSDHDETPYTGLTPRVSHSGIIAPTATPKVVDEVSRQRERSRRR